MYNKEAELYNMTNAWMSGGFDKLKDTHMFLGADLAKKDTFILELTQEELDFIYERCSRKAQRLEESGLKDIPCYRLSWQVMTKIFRAKEDNTAEVN